jgi:ferredoxin
VANPQSCKNNCPACARICPAAAIIFPKVGESPINGAEISDEEMLKANIRVNVDEILGNDVYAALNARKQKRQSLLNQKKVEQALAERKKCAEKNV